MQYTCGFCGPCVMPHHCRYNDLIQRLGWERDLYMNALKRIIEIHGESNGADYSPGMKRAAEAALWKAAEVLE